MLNFLLIILNFVTIIFLIYFYQKSQITITRNNKIEKENAKLVEEKNLLNQDIHNKKILLQEVQSSISITSEGASAAFQRYQEALENQYTQVEKEYDASTKILENSYDNYQNELLKNIENLQQELKNISLTKESAIAASKREEEIAKNRDFYTLHLSEIEKKEIHMIQSIESYLRDPRPLRMVVWSNYYLKRANELASNVLGPATCTGIYKITDLETGQVYIGQARDAKERFREHMKHGLGIDTPAGNKLYKAMLEKGLENFSFEIIEKCSSNLLNEKEKFYIDLYKSYDYGFNSNKGISKKTV